MAISVLGPLQVGSSNGSLGPHDRVVVEALALRPGEDVSAERLADALWGPTPPATWNKVVQGCISRLRRALGPDAIETVPHGYRLAVPVDSVDSQRFERLVRRGGELLTLGEPDRADHVLSEALDLWRGPPLTDVEDWEPGVIEAQRLIELRLGAEEAQLDAALRAGRHRDVVALARARVDEQPTHERRWALLALAQYQAGHQAAALRTIHEARGVLVRELGLDPGPDLVALEQAILRQDGSLAPPDAMAEPSSTCPWPGLVAYSAIDAEGFFGRDAEVATCLRRLTADGVLAVVGPSGSGKSSLVRAGLAASLQQQGKRVVIITPGGGHPRGGLTASAPGNPPAVLVVDQCEEALTAAPDPAAFFAELVDHAGRAPLVIVLRADHLVDVSAHPDFARLVEQGLFLLGPMEDAGLRAAIEGPARQAALLLEPGLVDLVLRDVQGEPGALPLMSHALCQTWARREGRTLTVDAYRLTGGIRSAVAQSAEAVYRDISLEEQVKLHDLMLRLVTPTEGGEPVRVRLPRRQIADDPVYEHLIEHLVNARLVTSDDGVVELAHEALARAWPRLRGWLEEDVEGMRNLRHLSGAADSWEAMGRPDSELYRGARLAQTLEWRDRARPELTPSEEAFVAASSAAEAAGLRAAEHQIRRERRTVRRLRRLVAGVAVMALLAGVSTFVAIEQRDRADDESTIADARSVAARALVAQPYDRALLLAVEAVRRWDAPETRGNLLTTIERSPQAIGVLSGSRPRQLEFALAADGGRAAVIDDLDDLTLYDTSSRDEVATLRDASTSYRAPAFSPDGKHIAVSRFDTDCWYSASDCGQYDVELRDARDLRPLGVSYRGLGLPAADVAYSANGDLVAAVPPFAWAGTEDNIAVWAADQPDEPVMRLSLTERGPDRRLTPDSPPPGWVGFSPDGSWLYASGAGPAGAFDLRTGQVVRTFEGDGALALSSAGDTLAVGGDGSSLILYDTGSGERLAELTGHGQPITAAAFSPDGAWIATASRDGAVAVWDVESGRQLQVFEGHAGVVLGLEFSPDGATLYSSAADRSLMMWDLRRTRGLLRQLVGPRFSTPVPNVVLVSPTAKTSAVFDHGVTIVDLDDGRTTKLQLEDPDRTSWGAYAPDGLHVVTVSDDGTARLWEVATGEPAGTRPGRGRGNLGAVAFTPDGEAVVVADADGIVTELDAEGLEPTGRTVATGVEPVGVRTGPDGRVAVTTTDPANPASTDVVFADLDTGDVREPVRVPISNARANFSADGSRYAVGGFDGRLRVIDVRSGVVAGPADPVHDGPVAWVAFSPDGRTLASIGFDGQLVLSDAADATARARLRPGAANLGGGIAFGPDGHTMIVAYNDGSAVSYDTDPDAWIDHACAVAGRNLTADEWRDAFGDRAYRETCPGAG